MTSPRWSLRSKGFDLAGVAEALGVDELLAGSGQAALGA